jgi:hypothetical protein
MYTHTCRCLVCAGLLVVLLAGTMPALGGPAFSPRRPI